MTKQASHAAHAIARRRRDLPKSGAIKRAVAKTTGFGPTVAGVQISHPDRLIYPDLEISKIELARYYERNAEWVVPHVAAGR
jgi:bifunctional non-homologous end joining protein LigD